MLLSTSDCHVDNILTLFSHWLCEHSLLTLMKIIQKPKSQIKTIVWQEFHCSYKAATLKPRTMKQKLEQMVILRKSASIGNTAVKCIYEMFLV